jgi:hypothetical protein
MGPTIAVLSNRRKQVKTTLFDCFAMVVTGSPIHRLKQDPWMGPAIAVLSNRRKQVNTMLFACFAMVVTG